MKRLLKTVCVLGAVLAACVPYDDDYYYDYAYYDPYYYGYDASFVYGWYDPYGVYYFASVSQAQTQETDLSAAASSIAARAPAYYTPAGCVTATASGAAVTYDFANCVGQFGSRPFSGTLTVQLSQDAGQLVFTGSSSNLLVDDAPFVVDVTATASAAGTRRVLTIESRSRSPDRTDTRQTQGTMTWEQGSGCFELNAQGSSIRETATTTSTLANFERCAGQCPSSGTITVQGPEGTFTSTFSGGDSMTVTRSDGPTREFDLQCQ